MTNDDLSGLRIREAVRALVVADSGEILLAHLAFPSRAVWVLPGGGLEDGESHRQGLVRELHEEAGFVPNNIGPHLWTRTHIIPFIDGKWDGQREHAYLVRTTRFDPKPLLSPEQLRAEYLVDLRWWSVDELLAEPDTTFFAPLHLPNLVRDVVTAGPPDEPWQIFQRTTPGS